MRVISEGGFWVAVDHPWQGGTEVLHQCACGETHHLLVWSTDGGVYVVHYRGPKTALCRQIDLSLVLIQAMLCG